MILKYGSFSVIAFCHYNVILILRFNKLGYEHDKDKHATDFVQNRSHM